ncbi:MAG: hypothetical protein BZ138_08415, partial [Methanosphaera sp. rholeuAM270]
DQHFPSWHGESGAGKPDVMLFDYFGRGEISLIVEDKSFSSNDDPTPQAICYAAIGDYIGEPVRIIIGNHPKRQLDVRVLSKDGNYEPLIINGEKVTTFFGEEVLKLVYNNPGVTHFILNEHIDEAFSQQDFASVISKLKTVYRQTPEIQNHNNLSINFTVALVALQMIVRKQGKKWSDIRSTQDLRSEAGKICDEKRHSKTLYDKYKSIFVIENDEPGTDTFNFLVIVDSIDVRENQDGVTTIEDTSGSCLIKMVRILDEVPADHLDIDLFGEVYESLADKKTKKTLGEFFTRRHIIDAIVELFLREEDIERIVNQRLTVADTSCGTGGFITGSFKRIQRYCEEHYPNMDIKALANDIMIGYDINPESVGRTRINMTLAGDGFSDIQRVNTLTANIS